MCISSRCAHRTVCRQHRPSPSHRDATLQTHSQLYAAAQVPCLRGRDERPILCSRCPSRRCARRPTSRGARAGGARVDRRRGARNGAARPRAVGALERLVLVLVVVVPPLGRAAHAARVETGGRRRALNHRWHRPAQRAARARRCCTRRCTSHSPPRRHASPTSTRCRRPVFFNTILLM